MPKSRKADREHLCDFCGQHKDDVPLVVVSNQTGACVCSMCALAVVEQTFALTMKQDKLIRQAISGPQNPQIEIAKSLDKVEKRIDQVDAAIGKALHGNT